MSAASRLVSMLACERYQFRGKRQDDFRRRWLRARATDIVKIYIMRSLIGVAMRIQFLKALACSVLLTSTAFGQISAFTLETSPTTVTVTFNAPRGTPMPS